MGGDDSGASRRGAFLLRGSLLLLVALAFGPALGGGFVWDDHLLISNNAAWRSASGLWHALVGDFWQTSIDIGSHRDYYRPLVSLAYYLEFQLFGLDPFGYHLVSLLLHASCVLLVLAWLRARLAPAYEARSVSVGAAIGAAWFALHPTRTESVSWISGCTDLWMTLFLLSSALCLRSPRTRARLLLAALCAAAALLCKEAALMLPALLALDAWLLSPAEARRDDLRAAGAIGATMLVVMVVRAALVSLPSRSLAAIVRQPVARVLSSFGHYLEATFVPFAPTVLRGKVAMTPHGELVYEPGSVALGALGFALIAIACVLAVRRAALRPWLADGAWFVVALAPVLNLIPLELKALVADRYLYLPMLGVSALLARAVSALWSRTQLPARLLLGGAWAATALAFIAVVWVQGRAFASDPALWERELALDPARAYVLESSTTMSMNARDYPRALAIALAGMKLAHDTGQLGPEMRFELLALESAVRGAGDSDQPRLLVLRAAYDQLATEGRAELALEPVLLAGALQAPALRLHLRLLPAQRALLAREVSDFLLVRAELHARTADLPGARALLESALRAFPRSPDALARLASIAALEHDFRTAQAAARAAVQLAPAMGVAQSALRAVGIASQLAAAPAADERTRALRDAQIDLLLGAFGLARARLAAALATQPDDIELIALAARTDALDHREDLARARIEQAQRAHPEAGPQWLALLSELRAARTALAQRSPGSR